MRILYCIVLVSSIFASTFSQTALFSKAPRNFQLYARGEDDSATVPIEGTVYGACDSVSILSYKNDVIVERNTLPLSTNIGDSASFALSCRIHAELSEYRIDFYLNDVKTIVFDSLICGDVYIVEGQSNAGAGYGAIDSYSNEFIRSFGSLLGNTTGAADSTRDDTTFGRAHAVASYWSIKPLPHCYVGKWALQLGRNIVDSFNIPVCIINGAVGSTSIATHTYGIDIKDMTRIYGRLYYRLLKAGFLETARAFIWYQGEADGDTSGYYTSFDKLYKAWKSDCPGIRKFYLFQIHTGTQGSPLIREVHRKLPKNYSDVFNLSTCGIVGHDGLHFSLPGYKQMADWIFKLIARDFYGSTDTDNITSPDIQKVICKDNGKTIIMRFNQPVLWPNDTLGVSMWQALYFDAANIMIDSVKVDTGNNEIALFLNEPTSASTLSYPNILGVNANYKGPWLLNQRGVGAFTFDHFPISYNDTLLTTTELSVVSRCMQISCAPNPMFRTTTISGFPVSKQEGVYRILDASGRCLRKFQVFQKRQIEWDGHDNNGKILPSGIYIGQYSCERQLLINSIVLMR
jgi:hypothetical protein